MNTSTIPQLTSSQIEHFWAGIDKTEGQGRDGKCWDWQRGCLTSGYGKLGVMIDGKLHTLLAHRISYWLTYGKDPGELCVLHKCDRPVCCNPAHFFLGTRADNALDRAAKRRSPSGENHWTKLRPERVLELKAQQRFGHVRNLPNPADHPRTVLNADKVREIRRRAIQGEDNRSLAKEFNVTHSNISAVIKRKSWKHIE